MSFSALFVRQLLTFVVEPEYTQNMSTKDTQHLGALIFSPQKLREARQRRFPDMSRRRVARELLSIPHQNLADYESGRSTPNPTLLLRIGRLYGIDLQELGVYSPSG
jgi:hypothetical protein